MQELIDDFFAFLPNLIGAFIVGSVGAVFVVGPYLVWRSALRPRVESRWPGVAKPVECLLYIPLAALALIVVSLVINTLGIDGLTDGFRGLIPLLVPILALGLIALFVWSMIQWSRGAPVGDATR